MKNLKNKKGFTIVELVIVIAVIAILAAVLIPTFGGVIEKANASKEMQAARNLYTEFLTEANEEQLKKLEELDYVLYNGKYYTIADFDATPKDANALSVGDSYVSESNGNFTITTKE